ncbi:bifunctional 4-hydroxy-2-oxoglutarate aldolase/2-dehydro-3-deoxy-phosphogluconate aldolase [Sediminibacillus albus]|uniref:2-dehydro-3-deoxyphosphogluconate aldolase / (4S)-4-hydroxy-2-oxoglutarate aldolase n=1 Tax=Sediminibacillus albus TaxID=407036 RepID=A0A1G8YLD2_9BACI|nr:bifunctional 4-hydroxy-2-oxoglutarate aldolase/2-dehydro-3-deoxy-phosphogluconate aldolase [Sediminibacillus albus]SDK03477.1 2-dehydro-3-deoxyphosphogluconate aldolase / (4S)-4-hydroxy-2-oxoglutarate aldolase [Sediminibacillus albus]
METKQTIDRLYQAKVIPVVRKVPVEDFHAIVTALISGGISAIEVTMDSPSADQLIKEAKDRYGKQAVIGAGTVINMDDFERAVSAGAEFIVSPNFDRAVVTAAKARGLLVIPGVFSPSEMVEAIRLGANMVKVFPAGTLGADFIKNVKGPLSDIPIMCTGGIDLTNAADFFEAGATLVGAGGALINNQYIETKNWGALTAAAEKWMQV